MSVIVGIGFYSFCLLKYGFVFRGVGENFGFFCIGCFIEKVIEFVRSLVYFIVLVWLVLNFYFC